MLDDHGLAFLASLPRHFSFDKAALCQWHSVRPSIMNALASTFICMAMLSTTFAAEKDTRCYELRTYYAAPGKLDELHARFREHTRKIFEKHHMSNIGYWVPLENTDDRLIYLLAFPSREAHDQSWKDFGNDPEWKEVARKSEANGRLVSRIESVLLNATDYSPEIRPARAAGSRVFELRTYTASSGNLDALDERFRSHTLKLFSKHGMEHVGYWHLLADKDQNKEAKKTNRADNTLIYLLSHRSKEAADASFNAFRNDPEWISVKGASEKKAGGPLTEGGQAGVKSVFLKATDYSPMQ